MERLEPVLDDLRNVTREGLRGHFLIAARDGLNAVNDTDRHEVGGTVRQEWAQRLTGSDPP